ncbi:MAG: sodium-dependent transporter [Oscillospiraceae bacterium]|nr:sodium-dependent transporter [Oscillospiraceae bacterium]
MEKRERLGSRLGFILLSAGCAIGCGNVWKFPWMCGQYGGGSFILVYVICLLVLGLPVMTMEFSVGRAAQKSPLYMYQQLEKKGQKWHLHGCVSLIGNLALMAFYTVVTGWIIYYFVQFLTGRTAELGFVPMITNGALNMKYLAIAVVLGFGILCFDLQGGLERITKVMMVGLLGLMLVLVVNSFTLSGAAEGLRFYLVPDISKITGPVIVGAMNQAFFTLSLGMGSMAIFGSYIDKDRTLMGESVNIICLDTLVAVLAGLIMFPACFTYGVQVDAGPSLLFNTMATVFNNMNGGRIWGTMFFLFMTFAAMSTVLAVCENILAMVREMTGWSRPVGSLVCGVVVFALASTTALGYSRFSGFVPFAEGSAWLDFWDFIVSTNVLPLGSICYVLFCTTKKGWGWDNFVAEANAGKGLKVQNWMRPICTYFVPVAVAGLYIYGLVTFGWK